MKRIIFLLILVFSFQSFGGYYFRMYKTGVSVNFFRPIPEGPGWWRYVANNVFKTTDIPFPGWPSIGPIYSDSSMSQSVYYTVDRIEDYGVGSDTYKDVFLIVTTNEPESVICQVSAEIIGIGSGSTDIFIDFGGAYSAKNWNLGIGGYKKESCGIYLETELPSVSFIYNCVEFDSATQTWTGSGGGSGTASFQDTGEIGDDMKRVLCAEILIPFSGAVGIDPESLPPSTNSPPSVPEAPDSPSTNAAPDSIDYGDMQAAMERALAAQGAGDSGIIDAINQQGFGIKKEIDSSSSEIVDSIGGLQDSVDGLSEGSFGGFSSPDGSGDYGTDSLDVDGVGDSIEGYKTLFIGFFTDLVLPDFPSGLGSISSMSVSMGGSSFSVDWGQYPEFEVMRDLLAWMIGIMTLFGTIGIIRRGIA